MCFHFVLFTFCVKFLLCMHCREGGGGLRLSAMFSRECEFDPITSLVEEIFNFTGYANNTTFI